MKSYVKPDAGFVDVRVEERLAAYECYDPSQTGDYAEIIKDPITKEDTVDLVTAGCRATIVYENLLLS